MVEVGVAQLRRELKSWLARVQDGDEVVVTDRGRPVARLSGVGIAPILDQLVEEGVISRDAPVQRPAARGRRRVASRGEVSELVIADRDSRR